MSRRVLSWLLPLPLVAIGGLAAHSLAYRLAAPASHDHTAGTSAQHGLGAWWVCAGICGAIAIAGLAAVAIVSVRRGATPKAPLWLVALVPPLGFTGQEELGRLLHTGALSSPGLASSFVLGLLLQVPVALLALLLVRTLLTTALVALRALRSEPPRRPARITRQRPAWTMLVPSLPALALGYGERGPPALLRP